MTQPARRGRPPKSKEVPAAVSAEVTTPEEAPARSEHLCERCFPDGWPAREYGAHAGCSHGSWTYSEE